MSFARCYSCMTEGVLGNHLIQPPHSARWPAGSSRNMTLSPQRAANNCVNATVRPVTPRACARVTPGRPARYAARYAFHGEARNAFR